MNAPAFDGVFRRGDRGETKSGEKYRVLHVKSEGAICVLVDEERLRWFFEDGRTFDQRECADLLPPTKRRKPKPASAAEVAKVALPWSEVLGEDYGSAGFRVSVDETDVAGTTVVKLEIQSRAPAWLPSKDARRLAAALLAAADAAEAPAPAPAEPPAPATLVLRLGRHYRTRDGRQVVVVDEDLPGGRPFMGAYVGSGARDRFTADGRILVEGGECVADLIAEWTDGAAS